MGCGSVKGVVEAIGHHGMLVVDIQWARGEVFGRINWGCSSILR